MIHTTRNHLIFTLVLELVSLIMMLDAASKEYWLLAATHLSVIITLSAVYSAIKNANFNKLDASTIILIALGFFTLLVEFPASLLDKSNHYLPDLALFMLIGVYACILILNKKIRNAIHHTRLQSENNNAVDMNVNQIKNVLAKLQANEPVSFRIAPAFLILMVMVVVLSIFAFGYSRRAPVLSIFLIFAIIFKTKLVLVEISERKIKYLPSLFTIRVEIPLAQIKFISSDFNSINIETNDSKKYRISSFAMSENDWTILCQSLKPTDFANNSI